MKRPAIKVYRAARENLELTIFLEDYMSEFVHVMGFRVAGSAVMGAGH
jgi:hypothetical protein